MKYKSSQYCPNCHFPLPYKAKFCARCGQKNDDGRISIRALFKLIWFRVLHLESRSLHFMWLLFIPGYVTAEFFNGHRKRYPQPIRFFFIIMFIFLFAINHQSDGKGWRAGTSYNGIKLEPEKGDGANKLNFYELGKRYVEFEKMRQEFDSLPEAYRQLVVQLAIDSLLQRTYGKDAARFKQLWKPIATADSSHHTAVDSLDFDLGSRSIKVALLDVFRHDAEIIAKNYQINGWTERLLLRQALKAMQEPDALMKTYLGNLVWTLLAVVALMSAVLTMLYWRQGRYYVEHFIFLLNEHSAIFLLITLGIVINDFWPHGWFWIPLAGWIVLSRILAMRRFYRQGWGVTLLKWVGFSVAYTVGFVTLFLAGMLVVFIVF